MNYMNTHTSPVEIKKWLSSTNRDRNWIVHNFSLTIEEVNKWLDKGEKPSIEHEETLLQFMYPTIVNLYIYQPWEIAKKIFKYWRLKGTDPYRTNDIFEFLPSGTTYCEFTKHSNYQVICFSRSVSSAAMWGHYADRHKGVCLAFSFPITPHNEPLRDHWRIEKLHEDFLHNCLYDVSYKEDRVVLPPNFPIEHGEIIEELITTKDKSWIFEEEMRLVCLTKYASSADDEGNIYFSDVLQYLSGIVLGIRFPYNTHYVETWYKQLKSQNCEIPNIKIKQACLDDRYFKINNTMYKDTPKECFPIRKLHPKKIAKNGFLILPYL